jgi:hypothetical protein
MEQPYNPDEPFINEKLRAMLKFLFIFHPWQRGKALTHGLRQ